MPQRRSLRSDRHLARPPGTAASREEVERRSPASRQDSAQVGGGLRGHIFPRHLGAEELKIREASRETSEPQNQVRNLPNDGFSFKVGRKTEGTSAYNISRVHGGMVQDEARGPSISTSGNMQTAPTSNKGPPIPFHSLLPNTTKAGTESLDIAQGWKHVKRSIPQNEAGPDSSVDFDPRIITKHFATPKPIADWLPVGLLQRARLEQTKDGKFVQLETAVLQNESKSLRSQEKVVDWKPDFSALSQQIEPTPSVSDNASNRSTKWNALPPIDSNTSELSSQKPVSPSGTYRTRNLFRFTNQRGGGRNTSLMGNSDDTVEISSQADVNNTLEDASRFKGVKWTHSAEKYTSSSAEESSLSRTSRLRSTPKPRQYLYPKSSSPHVRGTLRFRERMNKRFSRAKQYDKDEDYVDAKRSRLERRQKKIARKMSRPPKQIYLPEFITVSNLATVLKLRVEDFGRRLRELGFEATNNDLILDAENAGLIAAEFNFEPIVDTGESHELVARPPAIDSSILPQRPPVVTIMGHVDHGKTTLLDWLRKSSIAASEHGGITQHIGAFSVPMPGGRLITFLDTPGHAAFLSMRQRGANVTDIVILVVAADDSVKPQTIEAIQHAKAAKVPMIVAVSKIDKEEAKVERVKHDLARHGLELEDFGGDTQVVCISGKTGQGMADLEEATNALADILDKRAETDGQAEGWVLESTTSKGGRIATVLVQRGTITCGDFLVAGLTWAKVRCLRNEAGAQVITAGPGTPIEVDGWKDQPAAGDEVLQAPDEKTAKSVSEHRNARQKSSQMALDMVAINESRRIEQEKRDLEKIKSQESKPASTAGVVGSPIAGAAGAAGRAGRAGREAQAAGADRATGPVAVARVGGGSDVHLPHEPSKPGVKEVIFVIKADVSGSIEAVLNSISALGNSEVFARVLRSGVGHVTEFDIEHAAIAKGHIICFNILVEPKTAQMAKAAGVKILDSRIIYKLMDDVKSMLSEQLAPIITQKVLGEAEVAQIFQITTKNKMTMPVAGCRVRNGVMSRNKKVKVLREREVIYDGTLFLSFIQSISFWFQHTSV